jgi:hypothetical protein
MSKSSHQKQPATQRDRKMTPVPGAKQGGKAVTETGKSGTREKVSAEAANDKAEEFAVVPAESAEDDFFARGDVNSYPPAALDRESNEFEDDRPEIVTLTPAQIERRARLRRIVGGVVGAAAVLTAVVGAKALSATPAKVHAAQGSLNMPHQVVASIVATAEEPAAKPTEEPPVQPAAEKADEPANVAAQAPAPGPNAAATAESTAPAEPPAEPPTTPAQAANETSKGAEPAGEQAPAPANRRLPVIDVEIPATSDPAVDKQWESAAKNLSSKDFKAADNVFAELGKKKDAPTRETARLARAVWWTANGRRNEVKPVIADLAANATTPSVRQQAQSLLHAN